ncbi:MAG: heparan-alpha-glucosaminide N-acetyltransferase domain-containing protein [Verrucomicrobiota bacterium]
MMMGHRYLEIDYTKGILTAGMVFGHVVLILGNGQGRLIRMALLLPCLATYSGFLFCFGFAVWVSYLSKPRMRWASILKTALKCYLAFIASGFAWKTLALGQHAGWKLLLSLCFLRDIPSYSEFLLSFSIIMIAAAVAAPAMELFTRNKTNLATSTLAFLAFTLLPKEAIYDPLVGLFLGGSGFFYFPALPYMPLFLLGVYFARRSHDYDMPAAAIALLVVAIYGGLEMARISLRRFPPSAVWILSSAALTYLYYGAGRWIDVFSPNVVKRYLSAVGQHVLYYLLVSNLILFGAAALGVGGTLRQSQVVIFYLGLMIFLFCIQCLTMDLDKVHRSTPAPKPEVHPGSPPKTPLAGLRS